MESGLRSGEEVGVGSGVTRRNPGTIRLWTWGSSDTGEWVGTGKTRGTPGMGVESLVRWTDSGVSVLILFGTGTGPSDARSPLRLLLDPSLRGAPSTPSPPASPIPHPSPVCRVFSPSKCLGVKWGPETYRKVYVVS